MKWIFVVWRTYKIMTIFLYSLSVPSPPLIWGLVEKWVKLFFWKDCKYFYSTCDWMVHHMLNKLLLRKNLNSEMLVFIDCFLLLLLLSWKARPENFPWKVWKGQDPKDTALRLVFLRWQCQLKQHHAVPLLCKHCYLCGCTAKQPGQEICPGNN